MSGLAAILKMMQKPYNQHMNDRFEQHPANQLTHILVHQPDDIREQQETDYIDKWVYSLNMEL